MKDFRIPLRSVWNNPGNRNHRATRLMRALKWQFSKHIRGRTRILHLPSGALFKAYPDCVISSALIYADWPEFHEMMFVRKMIRSNQVAIDIGANVGHILLSISDIIPASGLFAFEPTPVSFRRLKGNWLLNHWPTENLYQVAISDAAGAMYIQDISTPTTTNALHLNASTGSVPVRVAPLDSFLDLWRGSQIGLLKIDVEGFEAAVFRGATAFFQELSPKLVMFESLQGKLDNEIGDVLRAVGYDVFQLDTNGEPQFGRAEAQNLFAIPGAPISSRSTRN